MKSKLTNKALIATALLVAMLVLHSSPLTAQTFFGSIVGTVTNASGAVVPDTEVTVTNIGTNEKHTAQTNAAGDFRFVNLVPADYRVEATMTNFKRLVLQPVTVQVGGTTRADLVLQAGSTTEVVQMTTQGSMLQTDTGAQSQTVSKKTVQEMPLNGRNMGNLVALNTGVVSQGGSTGGAALNNTQSTQTNQTGWGNYQIGGGISGQNAQYFDGAPMNLLGENDVAMVPTQDAIQEFSVMSNSVGADFGRFGGGVVNITSKSGSNAWHGSAYEYLRNRVFNANSWFNKQTELSQGEPNTPPQWNQNQYGVVFGGPIKRNKAFFLFNWEGFKARTMRVSPTNVPTADMQNGIFDGKKLTDPLGRCTALTYNAATNTTTIPSSCWSSTASVMKQYYNAANSTATGSNYTVNAPIGNNQNQYNGRIDFNVSAKQRVFGHYTYWGLNDIPFNQFPGNPYNNTSPAIFMATHEAVLGDTYTFNPRTILDVRVSFLRQKQFRILGDLNVDESEFGGNWGTLENQMSVHMYPLPRLNGSHNIYSGFHYTGPGEGYQNLYSINANLVRIIGRHSLKAGLEDRLSNLETLGNSNSGAFTFNGQYSGDEFADMLLGYPQSGYTYVGAWTTGYNYYQGYYLRDDWTATKKLTVNMGIRWELPGGIDESHDKNTVLLPNTTDPNTSVKGTMALVNTQLYSSRSTLAVRHALFAPRLSFAYRLGGDMAVRGGYGLTYLPPDVGGIAGAWSGRMPINSDVNAATSSFVNPTSLTSGVTYHLLDESFSSLIQPTGRSNPAFMKSYLGGAIGAAIPTDPYPYMQQWHLSVSRQLKGDLLVELGYVGSKGTHLPVPVQAFCSPAIMDLDELDRSHWSETNLNSTETITTPAGYSETVTQAQAERPYPFFSNVGDTAPDWGSTTYHASELTVEKRFKSGGRITGHYSWSKLIGNTDTSSGPLEPKSSTTSRTNGIGAIQDWNDHQAERSILSYNTPNRLVASYILPLPFGQGQRWGANLNGIEKSIISGWTLNGITTLQSGFPLTFEDDAGNSLTNNYGAGVLRPNYTAGCNKTVPGSTRQRIGEWFNTGCFSIPGSFALGDEPRVDGTLRAEGGDNWDMSLLKSTRIIEGTKLDFRAEFFNAFNRTQFLPPVIDPSTSNFGHILAQGNQPRLMQLSLRLSF